MTGGGLEEFEGSRVLVIGAARSGLGAAQALYPYADRIVLSDVKSADELKNAVELAENLGIEIVLGEQGPDLLEGIDLIVRSPGVPWTIPVLEAAVGSGITVIGELELAYRALPTDRIIAVTGSNGKSTTVELTGKMFEAAGVDAVVAGNVGRALSDTLPYVNQETTIVLEVSSFQLEDTVKFHPYIAVLLNLSADHLDHHRSVENYFASKWRLFENQTESDWAVLSSVDPAVFKGRYRVKGRQLFFGPEVAGAEGVWDEDGRLVYRIFGTEGRLVDVRDVKMWGAHNLLNAMAASCAALAAGLSPGDIVSALRTFRGLPHRLEEISVVAGVKYVNDSKATNVASAITGIQSFGDSIILIAGGRHKGGSFEPLAEVVGRHCRAVVVYGEARGELEKAFAGVVPVETAATIPEAVRSAAALAKSGDIVLLSPACTSWDQYAGFEERGDDFRQTVLKLRRGSKQ
jgi:UDP-N-acetylmuramoylalanine--D-glutamate ligase